MNCLIMFLQQPWEGDTLILQMEKLRHQDISACAGAPSWGVLELVLGSRQSTPELPASSGQDAEERVGFLLGGS